MGFDRAPLLQSQQPHHQALEMMAAQALAKSDYLAAYKYADRRCRIEPPPLAHSFLLRAEAAHNLGHTDLAVADLTAALDISPDDIAAARRLYAWSDGATRRKAAAKLIALERNLGTIRAVIRDLPPQPHISVAVFDDYASGWVVWQDTDELQLSITSDARTLTLLLSSDPFHPLTTERDRATAFRMVRPPSSAPQMLSVSLDETPIFSRRMAPNLSTDPTLEKRSPRYKVSERSIATVIVPVYADFIATKRCLDGLLDDPDRRNYRIVIVNDASPDRQLAEYVQSLAHYLGVELRINPINLGFVGSVNLVMSEVTDGDIVLLNADTVVSPGFIERLHATAASSDDIGTVVPLSNNGGISDFPNPRGANPLGSDEQIHQIDQIAAVCNPKMAVDIPNGTGFCLYITRKCLDAVGLLSEHFQRGYFEDIDFCLRARQHGFRNVCATSVYVGHAGSLSFGLEKRALVLRNLDVLDTRFPAFRAECAAFITSDPVRSAREAIERHFAAVKPNPALLLNGVGAIREVAHHRLAQLSAAGHGAIMMDFDRIDGQVTLALSGPAQEVPQSLRFELSSSATLRSLRDYLQKLQPSHCEAFDPRMMARLPLQEFASLGIAVDLWIADDSLCTMEPAAQHQIIRATRDVLVACPSAFGFAEQVAGGRRPKLLPGTFPPLRLTNSTISPSEENCLAIIPARSSATEFHMIRSLALALQRRQADRSILIVGSTIDDVKLMSHRNVFVTGPIGRSELASLVLPYPIDCIVTGMGRPLLGHPVVEAAKKAAVPVAYTNWSTDGLPGRQRDLVLDPCLPLDQWVKQIVAWSEGHDN